MANSIYTYEYIDPVECMGDSLIKINNNNFQADNAVGILETRLQSLSSLINTLSSDMNQIINVPYARLAELPGKDQSISNLKTITGSAATNTNQPAQLIFPKSTAVTLTRYLTLVDTPANYTDTIGITKNVDRSFRFSSTGTYEIYVRSPKLSLHNTGGWAVVDLLLKNASGTTVLAGPPVSIELSMSDGPELRGRFTVTNTATNYFVELRRNQAGQNYGLCAGLPDTAGAGTLFNVEFWKVG